ncbi:acyl carrier protein [Panus rudis PR-1116 ss-1]|nr:acyl carrier protein [Panus rudis PR-1116 ss-1]
MSFFRIAARSVARPSLAAAVRPSLATRSHFIFQAARYSAAAGLNKEQITTRVLDVLKGFEKVDPAKVTPNASFTEDLGLDSLDAVEVVMAVEEGVTCLNQEFAIEIPDAEADAIKTVQQAIDYIAKTPEGLYYALRYRSSLTCIVYSSLSLVYRIIPSICIQAAAIHTIMHIIAFVPEREAYLWKRCDAMAPLSLGTDTALARPYFGGCECICMAPLRS